MDNPLKPDLLRRMDAYWRAANYLSVGQIYLLDNPLLRASRSSSSTSSPGSWATGGPRRARTSSTFISTELSSSMT